MNKILYEICLYSHFVCRNPKSQGLAELFRLAHLAESILPRALFIIKSHQDC